MVEIIYVVVGRRCNLNCIYCNQHDNVSPLPNEVRVSPNVYEVINRHKDICKKNGKTLFVSFYGGEPLLYWKQVKEIMDSVSDVAWGMVTNGVLIDAEKVEYLNAHNGTVTVSWDGENSKATRNFNSLADNPNILKLNHLCVTGVVSTENYPSQFIGELKKYDDVYYKLHRYHIMLNNTLIHSDKYVADVDYDLLSDEMKSICNIYKGVVLDGNREPYSELYESFINSMVGLTKDNHYRNSPCCGYNFSKLAINLDGDIQYCQSDTTVIAKHDASYVDINKAMVSMDSSPHRYDGMCDECKVQQICHNGCSLFEYPNGSDNPYCRIRNAVYMPIIDMVEDINNILEKRGFDNEFSF